MYIVQSSCGGPGTLKMNQHRQPVAQHAGDPMTTCWVACHDTGPAKLPSGLPVGRRVATSQGPARWCSGIAAMSRPSRRVLGQKTGRSQSLP